MILIGAPVERLSTNANASVARDSFMQDNYMQMIDT
jgi:hypothetical protein